MPSVIRGDDNFDSSTSAKTYRSGNTAWGAGGSYTFTHGLGVLPSAIMVEAICTTAGQGYSVGDVFIFHAGERYSNWNIVIDKVTTTSVTVRMHSAGIIGRTASSTTSQTLLSVFAQFRVVCKA